jgi:hypothetical protein
LEDAKMKTWTRSLGMIAALALTATSAHAAALFSPLDDDSAFQKAAAFDTAFQAIAQDPATASLTVVKANADLVSNKASSIALNLGPGLDLRAQRVSSYTTESGSLVWSGVILDPGSKGLSFDPINTVMMVKDGDTITANVHYNGEWLAIRPLKTGTHAIVSMDVTRMPADHPAEYRDLPVIKMPAQRANLDKANTIIRVMVNWTSSAASASGNISALVDLAVAEANQSYTNSGVQITMQLASKSLVTYTQSGSFSTDLSRYRGTSDGFMDTIHATRNTVTADVNMLVINNSSSCGLASSIGSTAATAFATAHWSCITGYYSFAHELGHLQSARHDPANDPTTTPYSYGHGYQYLGSPKWRTIMAYDCTGGCPRLQYWSSPLKTFNGVPMGTAATNDNARVLNNTRATVAAFR